METRSAASRTHAPNGAAESLTVKPVGEPDAGDRHVRFRAMTRKPEPIEWDETTTTAAAASEATPVEEEASTLTAH